MTYQFIFVFVLMLTPLVGRGVPEAVVLGNNCKIVFTFNYTRTYCAVAL